jgi:hypothetical protein
LISLIKGTNGDDTYRATLKNGWVFDSYHCRPLSTDNPGDSKDYAVIADGVFPYGQSQGEIDVSWGADHCDFIEYDCDISIKGPLGVPAYRIFQRNRSSTVGACDRKRFSPAGEPL